MPVVGTFSVLSRMNRAIQGNAGQNASDVSDDLVSTPSSSGPRVAAGTGTLVTGAVVVATGLATVTAFTASVKEPATGTYTTGANEVHSINVKSITTGAVSVDGVFNSLATGAATVSVSGTATFYWIAFGT